jgi:hypothetical protein
MPALLQHFREVMLAATLPDAKRRIDCARTQ